MPPTETTEFLSLPTRFSLLRRVSKLEVIDTDLGPISLIPGDVVLLNRRTGAEVPVRARDLERDYTPLGSEAAWWDRTIAGLPPTPYAHPPALASTPPAEALPPAEARGEVPTVGGTSLLVLKRAGDVTWQEVTDAAPGLRVTDEQLLALPAFVQAQRDVDAAEPFCEATGPWPAEGGRREAA